MAILSILVIIAILLCQVIAMPQQVPLKLLFSGPQDIADTWGKLHFGATSLERMEEVPHPGFEVSCCVPRDDGVWDIYGLILDEEPISIEGQTYNKWRIIHATTRDAISFNDIETVYDSPPGEWTFNHAMAYNPEAREFLLLKLNIDRSGFRYMAFFSKDGRNWTENPGNPLFYDGDAISLFWSPKLHRYVLTSKSFQNTAQPKHLPDHGGIYRRVLSIRSSVDGRHWEPSDSIDDVWNRDGRWKPLPDELLTLPDEQDPPDLEFYSGNGFWYHDRSYMMVLNYAATRLAPGKHGPQMDTEWWVAREGLDWERPFREVNALGNAFPGYARITHNPLLIDGRLLFRFPHHLVGMKEDRISFVGARTNGEFSTLAFEMPEADLYLNAAVPSPDKPLAGNQAYLMAALLDEAGQVIPGYEFEKCLIQNADQIDLPLLWEGKSAAELAGQTVRLRFYLRSANIYAVTGRVKPAN
mgnify:CR=1 FL=1